MFYLNNLLSRFKYNDPKTRRALLRFSSYKFTTEIPLFVYSVAYYYRQPSEEKAASIRDCFLKADSAIDPRPNSINLSGPVRTQALALLAGARRSKHDHGVVYALHQTTRGRNVGHCGAAPICYTPKSVLGVFDTVAKKISETGTGVVPDFFSQSALSLNGITAADVAKSPGKMPNTFRGNIYEQRIQDAKKYFDENTLKRMIGEKCYMSIPWKI